MLEKLRLDRKIGFQNTFNTKSVNITIDSIGPSIILRSIFHILEKCSSLVCSVSHLYGAVNWSDISCADPKTFVRGGPTLTNYFS